METLLPALDELVHLKNDKISKFGDMIFFTCMKYEEKCFFQLNLFDLFSSLQDLSEQSVIKRLKKMDTDDDDDDDDLLTVSRSCRPILEHKLVSHSYFQFRCNLLNKKITQIATRNTCCYPW